MRSTHDVHCLLSTERSVRIRLRQCTAFCCQPWRWRWCVSLHRPHCFIPPRISQVCSTTKPLVSVRRCMERRCAENHFIYLFRNSQLSTLYNAVKSRTEMTIVTAVRYQSNALADTFNADRVQCLTLLVHTSTHS